MRIRERFVRLGRDEPGDHPAPGLARGRDLIARPSPEYASSQPQVRRSAAARRRARATRRAAGSLGRSRSRRPRSSSSSGSLQAVEVAVVDVAVGEAIRLDQRVGRAAHGPFVAERREQAADQRGLAGAEIAGQPDDAARLEAGATSSAREPRAQRTHLRRTRDGQSHDGIHARAHLLEDVARPAGRARPARREVACLRMHEHAARGPRGRDRRTARRCPRSRRSARRPCRRRPCPDCRDRRSQGGAAPARCTMEPAPFSTTVAAVARLQLARGPESIGLDGGVGRAEQSRRLAGMRREHPVLTGTRRRAAAG